MFESKKNYRDSRLEFERHLNLLAELVNEGRIHITEKVHNSLRGMSEARYSPNNRVNLNTINETIRSMAMMASDQRDFQENEE